MRDILLWVLFEIVLTLAGLDDLADYGEFLFQPQCGSEIYLVSTYPIQ